MSQSYFKGAALCLTATTVWGGMFPVMSTALSHVDPFTFTSIRYAIAGLMFIILAVLIEGQSGIELRGQRIGLAWLFGTAGFAVFNFLIFFGQQLAGKDGALTASVMFATMPMLGLLMNWYVTKTAPSPYSFFFIFMSFVGVVFVVSKGNIAAIIDSPQNYIADGIMLFAALCWVIYTVGGTFFPAWSSYKYTAVTTVLGLLSAIVINVVLFASGAIPFPSHDDFGDILPQMAYMSLVAGVIGVLSWNLGNKIITPANGVLFMNAEPITTFIISAIQGNIPDKMQIVGASLTCTALVLNSAYLRLRAATASIRSAG